MRPTMMKDLRNVRNHIPSQVTNQGVANRFLLFYDQSDNFRVWKYWPNKYVRRYFFSLSPPSADFRMLENWPSIQNRLTGNAKVTSLNPVKSLKITYITATMIPPYHSLVLL